MCRSSRNNCCAISDFTGGEAEELRRTLGSRRSADKMRALEIKMRTGLCCVR